MNTTNTFRHTPDYSTQQGAVLVVGLIFLLIMTLLGVSSMSTSNLEEKMSGNTRDRELAFQAAESALREAERVVQDNWNSLAFDVTCTNGFCDCDPASFSSTTTCSEYWTDTALDVWNTAGRYISYTTTVDNVVANSKYIIEYMGTHVVPTDPVCNTCPKEYFRITTLGAGLTPASRVMLQTTYRID